MSASNTLTFQGDSVKCSIPRELYLKIAKIQVEEGLDWDEACLKSSELLNTGSSLFEKRVVQEARKLYDSELMKQVNKARKTIRERVFQEGLDFSRSNETNFQIPCSKCGKPMHFSDRDSDWEKERQVLYRAFLNWSHTKC